MTRRMKNCFLQLLLLVGFATCQEKMMSFSSPNLTEEEMHSSYVPDKLKCDACTAVAYQMTEALNKEEKKNGHRKLLESDYLDVFEKVCDSKTFEHYGVKQVGESNRLSGKGLEADSIPGMLMGGGKWPVRLSTKCYEFIDQLGEDDIYERYRTKRNLNEYLCQRRTSDCLKVQQKKEL